MPRGGKRRSWTPEEDATIRRLRSEGLPWEGVYYETGITPKVLTKRADELGIQRSPNNRPLTLEQRARIKRLHTEGMPHRMVADIVGCTFNQARKWGKTPRA